MRFKYSKKNGLALFALMILFACSEGGRSANAQSDPKISIDSFISQQINRIYEREKIPGIFVGVIDNGKRSFYTAGYADPLKKMRFDSATIFEAGSITKTFTAYILEKILLEKKISDTSSIIKFLPDSVQTNKALGEISFMKLLNHTTGLPRLPENMDLTSQPMAPYDNYTADLLFSYLRKAVPRPGKKSSYSNLGMGLAGVLSERISGKPYATLMNEYIFTPLGMNTASLTTPAQNNRAQGHFDKMPSDYWEMDVLAPAGGLKCSASDMLSYLQMILSPSNSESKKISDMLLEVTAEVFPSMRVGRAWHTLEKKDKPVIYWHDGGTFGFSTYAAFLKEKGKAVIVVINEFNKNSFTERVGVSILEY